jgi:hypothetical protein
MLRFRSLLAGTVLLAAVGCRPYDRPEFHEIDTSETGFLIPLEGDTGDQTSFDSERYLAERKVATKRVQIPHRWVQTGRLPFSGQWMPTVRLVKVDRSPMTREWTADTTTGTSTKNEAIWIESQDSVGFSVGFSCTAYIEQEDTPKFLYMYRSKSLAEMMDSEVRARVQQVAAEVAARYDLDELRAKKLEIIDAVREDVIPFFADRGITVTTVGMFGGFSYENRKIQEAIDETFIAQQLKVISLAKFQAQQKENERLELEAKAQANKVRTIAEGEADALRKIAEATQLAQQNPAFLSVKQLEVEQKRIEKWDGRYPTFLMGLGPDQGKSMSLLVQMPPVAQQ